MVGDFCVLWKVLFSFCCFYVAGRHVSATVQDDLRKQFNNDAIQVVLKYGNIRAAPIIAQEKFTAIYDVILLDEKFL